MVNNIIGLLIELVSGVILSGLSLYGLIVIMFTLAEDKTALGWTWILYLIVVPVGGILGAILGCRYFATVFK